MRSASGRERQILATQPPVEGVPAAAGKRDGARAARGARPLAVARDYLSLTKPRVVLLLLITTVPAMVVAAGGWPALMLVGATVLGGALSAGGANAVNCWFDRDIDGLMRRTSSRPTVTGAIAPARALTFGILLAAAAFVLLWFATTPLAALLSLLAFLFYVFVYTVWLKRRTDQNIVIGGAAGAFPPLVGWAAVTGDVSATALAMFAIIFLWTPPHFWALSLRLAEEYDQARIPMLPVTRGPSETARQVVAYTIILVATTMATVAFTPLGWLFAVSAAVLGAGFLVGALRLWRDPGQPSIGLYKYSLLYLALLFVAMAVDTLASSA